MITSKSTQYGIGGSFRSRFLEGSLGLGALVLLGAFVWSSLWKHDSIATPEPRTSSVAISTTSKIAQQRIANLRVGDRVLGENPEVSNAERATFADPEQNTWRKFTLRLAKPDGHSVEIELLRPFDDDDFAEAQPGQTIYLDLHELGAEGEAEVLAIASCPAIRMGAGNVITGTFHHSATNLIDLQLAGEAQPIGCTANHPFWSVDQEEFIPAGDLQLGEKVLSRNGAPTAVISSVVRSGLYPVYNIEVNREHSYRVGLAGILVHNVCVRADFVRMKSARQLANDIKANRVFKLDDSELAFVNRVLKEKPNLQIYRTNQKGALGDFLIIDRSNKTKPFGFLVDLKTGGGSSGNQLNNFDQALQVFNIAPNFGKKISGTSNQLLDLLKMGRSAFPQ